jgi:transcription antitermination factor NusG
MNTLSNVEPRGGEETPPSIRVAPDAIPEAKSSKTGVSVEYVPSPEKKWYVFRASYGREDRASDYLIEDGTYTYIAKRYAWKYVLGKRKRCIEKLIPNLLFAYTTADQAEKYVKRTPTLSFLSYYYNHFEKNDEQKNPPLTITHEEMTNFIRATVSSNEHLLLVEPSRCHYKSGERVRVIDGLFQGVEGKVARVSGQQRVIVTLSGIGLVSTAYIPTAFIEKLKD